MKKKFVGILVCVMLIVTALPAMGAINDARSNIIEQPEQVSNDLKINVIFVNGYGFKVIIQNLDNYTITVDAIVKLNATRGHIEGKYPAEIVYNVGNIVIEPYGSKTINTLPFRWFGIGRITVDIFDRDTGELICHKLVYCLMFCFYNLILPWTEK